jgi:streptogramin lyase
MNQMTITSDDGLPGNEIYYSTLGNGEIWMNVEGLQICRWNGYKLTCYDKRMTGLESPIVRLYHENDRLHVYAHGSSKYKVFENNEWIDIPHSVVKSAISDETLFLDSTGQLKRLLWDGSDFENVEWPFELISLNALTNYNDDLSFSILKNGVLLKKDKQNDFPNIIETLDSLTFLLGSKRVGSGLLESKNGHTYYFSNSTDIKIIPKEIIEKKRGSISSGEEIIITDNLGYAIYDLDRKEIIERLKNDGLSYLDKCDNMYYSNSHSGLLIFNSHIQFFEGGKDEMVRATHIVGEDNEGAIWFGGYKSGYTKYLNDNLVKIKFENRTDNALTGRLVLDDGTLILQSEQYNQLTLIKDGIISTSNIVLENGIKRSAFDIKEISEGYIAFGGSRYGLGLVPKEKLFKDTVEIIDKDDGFNLEYVFCITEDQNQRIWAASQQEGIAIYDRKKNEAITFHVNEGKSRFGITSLVLDSLDNLWIGSFEGLFIIENASSFDYIHKDPFNVMKKVPLTPFEGNTTSILQHDTLMIVAAEREVYFINLNQYYTHGEFDAYTYSYKHDIQGGASEENGMMIDSKNNLWVGTQEGYLQFELDNIQFDTTKVDLYLDEVIVAKESLDFDGYTIDLPPENRNFSYSYNLQSNPNLRNNIYTYSSLIDNKGDTLFTELYDPVESKNQFFLVPGDYSLVARTYKNNRLIDEDIYTVHAHSFLSEKTWFWPLILGVFLLSLFYFLRQKSKRVKLILEKDLKLAQMSQAQNQTQLKAIISSFNPHFINNSLHWAQSRYNEDETMVKVIGRLSENIQHIFVKTRKGQAVHSLREELRLVDNYVLIQKVRFKDSFEYIKPEQEIIDKLSDFQLPLMQLQIHVENAIEHGLRNRLESTHVTIEISEENDSIQFRVIDDGTGRINANEVGSKGTQSGTDMLKEVHNIFNQNNTHKITQYYEDNYLGTHGTIVIISIPKKYNYELG